MKAKLIILPNPILVSDEEIKEGDFMYLKRYHPQGQIRKCYYITDGQLMIDEHKDIGWGFCKKDEIYRIIAGIDIKLDLSDIAEKIGWVDVEKLAYKAAQKRFKLEHIPLLQIDEYGGEIKAFVDTYIDAYKAAQSLNEKKFSEEDMRKCYTQGITDCNEYMFIDKSGREFFEDYIQSLSKPKEYDVEVEMEWVTDDNEEHCEGGTLSSVPYYEQQPKITNNTIKVTKIL